VSESPPTGAQATAPESPPPTPAAAPPLPEAVVRQRGRHISWAWLVPVAALVLAALLAYQAMSGLGRVIQVRFHQGQGIQQNDPVMYRGVQVGKVRSVSLADDLDGVVVAAELRRDADGVAVAGSWFWIVRPEVSLRGVSGLETLLGPRYMEVEPGAKPAPGAPVISDFVGLDRAPVAGRGDWRGSGLAEGTGAEDGGLGLVLEATRLGSLSVGSPVSYRGLRVGSVMSIELGRDGRAVEVVVFVQRQYARLVRSNSRFWSAGGIGVDFGLMGGLTVKAGSLEAVLTGGVEFATPTRAGDRVSNGSRFRLDAEAEKDWLQWSPDLGD
jgi:paraquat-inducible protein B